MKITELNVNDSLGKKVRLANFSMKRLGSLVALIGKNGSGKTRILKLLPEYINEANISNGFIEADRDYYFAQDNASINLGVDSKSLISKLREQIVYLESDLLMNLDLSKKEDVIDFRELINSPTSIQAVDIVQLTKSAIYYFSSLSSRLLFAMWNASRKNQNADSVPNKHLFDLLAAIIKNMMGAELNYDADSNENEDSIKAVMTLDGQPFDYHLLSPGQKILFTYCIYFFLLESRSDLDLRNSIIVIDEPEKHLHPEAQIQLLNGLHSIVGQKGQLWIATHSVHILSALKPEEIFYVESSNVRSPSSFTPSKALEALMGYEYNYVDLIRLLLSTSEWAFAKFTSDCLINPNVIKSVKPDDPQFKQFVEFLRSKKLERVLDFGAGLGRLEKALAEQKSKPTFRLDAFEINPEFLSELESIEVVSQVYNNLDELKSGSYNLVVLSNVLHEIHVGEWSTTFKTIRTCLADEGYLMILEDLILPQGEAPNKMGYLVLNHKELRKLFSMYEDPLLIHSQDEKYRERIMCAVFKRSDLSSWGDYEILPAIEMLKKRSMEAIKSIREEANEVQGRILAFYNQQYINCDIAIDFLKNKSFW